MKLGGILTLLAQRLRKDDADTLRARAEALLGSALPSVKAPPTPGSQRFTTSLLAELRKR